VFGVFCCGNGVKLSRRSGWVESGEALKQLGSIEEIESFEQLKAFVCESTKLS
jgi:hypothetical protein